jgi:hypothetical protein
MDFLYRRLRRLALVVAEPDPAALLPETEAEADTPPAIKPAA